MNANWPSVEPWGAGRGGHVMLRSRSWQRWFVIAEAALSIAPLLAAGLMLRTFDNLLRAPIGFEPSHVVAARISLNLNAFSEIDQQTAFFLEAIGRVQAIAGVDDASVGGPAPFSPVQDTQQYASVDSPDAGRPAVRQR